MLITRNVLPLSDLYQWLEEKKLIINKDYQRGTGLWPNSARTYFIDTILNGYPFPKITLRQTINSKTAKAIREVVDGQQRLSTIRDFIHGTLRLSSTSKKYSGKIFEELDEETRINFLAYEISVDIITVGTDDEVLDIFRRMNSYTLPLNEAEKRHATYQGSFKWYILDMLNQYSPFFEKSKILTLKEIGRMKDADLMTELSQVIITGIEDRSPKKLDKLYLNNDTEFIQETECRQKLSTTIDYIKDKMSILFIDEKIPTFLFYSIFSALLYNKYGLRNISEDDVGYLITGNYSNNIEIANQKILEMLQDINEKNIKGRYEKFVIACISSTHWKKSRLIRLSYLVGVLQGKL